MIVKFLHRGTLRKIATVLCVVGILVSSAPHPITQVSAQGNAEWTFLVYLDGDNNLEGAGIDDFLEMSSVGSTSDVNIVVQFDRISGYDGRYDDWTTTKRFLVSYGMTPTSGNALQDIGEANMGDPQTLVDFAQWGMTNYPADRYALVLWDHGSGWSSRSGEALSVQEVVYDDTNMGDAINMPELHNAMEILSIIRSKPFDLVGFDACLMAMIEVDNQLIPYANMRVGSEETEPGDGWPYDYILSSLTWNPYMSASQLGRVIVDEYYASYGNDETLSAVDLQVVYFALNAAVDGLAVALISGVDNHYADIVTARNRTQHFRDAAYIDLYDFAYKLNQHVSDATINEAATDVMDALNAAIIHEQHGLWWWPGAHGISIYFPKSQAYYDSTYDGSQGWLQFTINTYWDEWLHAFYSADGGNGGSPGGGNGGSPGGPSGPVGPGGGSGIESGPLRLVSHATRLAREATPAQLPFILEDVLPVEGPRGTDPVFVTPQGPLELGNAVGARAVDFRSDPDDEGTTVAVALVTKTLTETYWHDYSVCARFNGYTLDVLTFIPLPGLAGASSAGEGPWFWYGSMHRNTIFEEAMIFSVFVNEAQHKFVVDSHSIRTEYACHWREPTSLPFDYVLNYQIWSSSGVETYRLLRRVFGRLSEVGPDWTITFASDTEPVNPTVTMNAATLVGNTVWIAVQNRLSEPRLVLFHGTKQICQGCADIPFEHWEVINSGMNLARLPLGDIANAVIYSEADNFLDKIYIETGVPGSLKIYSAYLPIVIKGSPLVAKSSSLAIPLSEPSINIVWPPEGASVIVEQDLTDEVDDYRLTIHGTVQGMRPGWTILVEVLTDIWYPQGAAAVEGELWGARVHLVGQGVYNNHKIRVTLLDERGTPVATAMVNNIVRMNPCQAP
jgi:hypothetical protein